MAERIFLVAALLIGGAYLAFAWTSIRAPIQYDPLGPESWPIILGGLIVAAAGLRLLRPAGARPELERRAAGRLAVVVAGLVLYAFAFERAGFVLATWGFCALVTGLLGARPLSAAAFGLCVGLLGYLLFTHALDLRLPAGLLEGVL